MRTASGRAGAKSTRRGRQEALGLGVGVGVAPGVPVGEALGVGLGEGAGEYVV